MVLEWREREHGDVEEAVRADLIAQQALQILVSWWLEGQTRTIADAGGLLGSRVRVILDRWDVPHHRGGGHILYYWTFLRPCSARWWVYHEHGCGYFDG